jgi:hypothetical protein
MVRMFELDDFVFYSELLAFQIGDCVKVWRGPTDFLTQDLLQVAMLGPELFDTLLRRHSTSCGKQMRYERAMLTPFGAALQARYAAPGAIFL